MQHAVWASPTLEQLCVFSACIIAPRRLGMAQSVKYMERLFVEPESMVRHLMSLGNKGIHDTA